MLGLDECVWESIKKKGSSRKLAMASRKLRDRRMGIVGRTKVLFGRARKRRFKPKLKTKWRGKLGLLIGSKKTVPSLGEEDAKDGNPTVDPLAVFAPTSKTRGLRQPGMSKLSMFAARRSSAASPALGAKKPSVRFSASVLPASKVSAAPDANEPEKAVPTRKSFRDLKGLGKLKRAVRMVKLGNRLDSRVKHGDDTSLKLWYELHRQVAPESRLLGKGKSTCPCVHPFPSSEYEPEHLCARGKLHWEVFQLRNRSVVTLFTLWVLLYLPVSTKILSFFLCEEIGSTWRLVTAREHICFNSLWFGHLPLAIGGVLLFVVALPIGSLYMVYLKRIEHVQKYLNLLQPGGARNFFAKATGVHLRSTRWAAMWSCVRSTCRRAFASSAKQRSEAEMQLLRKWRWEQARSNVGATLVEGRRGGAKFAEVVEEYDRLNKEELNTASELAKEDERLLGLHPTEDLELRVFRYL